MSQGQPIPEGTWSVDPVHSGIHFSITHNGIATFRSGFQRYEVTLVGGAEPRLSGSVEVASIIIDEPDLKGHLMSPEFFDLERHSQVRFASTELAVADDGGVHLAGDLELHGQTHSVAATGRFAELGADVEDERRLGLSVETVIDRRDWGLDWNEELPKGGTILEYEVTINAELQLVAEEP